MNVVRYYLCLCILMNHFNVLTGVGIPMLPRIFGGVGSFFAISGFLMFSSFEKRPYLKGYFDRRARRILPPYIFIVVLSAVLLSCVSSLSFGEYFSDLRLYKYIVANLMFVNFIEPSLPGVFVDSPNLMSAVNGSLWTMKGEVVCYISVPAVYAVIRRYSEHASHILCVLIGGCFIVYVLLTLNSDGLERGIVTILAKQFRVFTFFYVGALINIYLQDIKKYKWITISVALILLYISTLNGCLNLCLRPFTDSVMVIWFSMVGTWGHFLSRYNSLSYDVYLIHFPVIQLILALGLMPCLGAYGALAVTIVVSFATATFSWFVIGKPILNKRFF